MCRRECEICHGCGGWRRRHRGRVVWIFCRNCWGLGKVGFLGVGADVGDEDTEVDNDKIAS